MNTNTRTICDALLAVAAAISIAWFLTGCTLVNPGRESTTPVYLKGDVTPDVMHGADAWRAIGFTPSDVDSGLPSCAGLDLGGCQIEITIRIKKDVANETSVYGYTDTVKRAVVLDWLYTTPTYADGMPALAAHEIGHAILRSPEHLSDEHAVMYGYPTNEVLDDADKQHACDAIGVCP
jgi:hypothetical protein